MQNLNEQYLGHWFNQGAKRDYSLFLFMSLKTFNSKIKSVQMCFGLTCISKGVGGKKRLDNLIFSNDFQILEISYFK